MVDAAVLKKIKINTGVLKRMVKEHASYVKEVENLKVKIEKMKSESKNEDDEYAIKKTGEVLVETNGMIGDAARRCGSYLDELKRLVSEHESEDLQEIADAKEQILAAEALSAA